MFRPFLPCGIAYGSAYGIPCSFSGGRHPAGLFVLYHIGAVLVNRFRQNFGGICLFPAPGGGCPRVGGDCSGVAGALRGACLVCRLLTLPLVFDFCPLSPQPPSPAGKGETQSLFRRGLRPRHPCTEPLAALTDPARTGTRRHHSQGTDSCRFCGEPWVQPRGCKGRSPLHKKTKNLPLPLRGRGAGGWGQQSKLKAGAAGDKQGKPPLRIPERQGQPMTSRASPPPARDTRPCSGAARVQPRGCKGRSPLHKKTKNLPLPAGKGVGGMGARKQAKGSVGRRQARQATPADSGTARSADDQPGKPPHHPRAAYASSREAAVWAESRKKEG